MGHSSGRVRYRGYTIAVTIRAAAMDLKLHIGAFTPETIPMERLAKYLAEFSKLLGEKASVHLVRVDSGSAAPVAAVTKEASPKVLGRLHLLNANRASKDVQSAYANIDRMLEEDNATGKLVQIKEIGRKRREATIITFPGASKSRDEGQLSVKEESSIDGELVGLKGTDDTIHAHLRLASGETQSGIELSKEQAIQLTNHMWSGLLRLHGLCSWERLDGQWVLKKMRVSSFDVLEKTSLSSAVMSLREISRIDIDSDEGAVEFLLKLRREG